jgi:predicted ATPase
MPQIKKQTASEIYIQKAVLEGYRTIKRLEVEFLPGLNVIVGKNGTGKTNLMEYLHQALSFGNRRYSLNGEVVIAKNISQEPPLSINYKTHFRTHSADTIEDFSLEYESSMKIAIGEEVFDDNSKNRLTKFLTSREYIFNSALISHGIPSQFYFFSEPFNYSTSTEDRSKLASHIFSPEVPLFLKIILAKFMFFPVGEEDKGPEIKEAEVKYFIEEAFSTLEKLKEPLKAFSIIDDIKLSDKYNIYLDVNRKVYTIQNLLLEFKVNDQWLPFNSLSDGTKRLIYIINEVLNEENYYFFFNSITLTSSNNRIILLEEPELGLHPHLLSQLMNFLREQAKHKQIIISTHSPIVLDSVAPDELDRIQIAELTPEGTQLRRLTLEQQAKARVYAQETGLLSDYWRFSDLEA